MINYYYELKLINGQNELTHHFPADIAIETLKENLENFLLASGWNTEIVNELFGGNNE